MNISNISSSKKNALYFEDISFTFEDLVKMSRQRAGTLEKMGIKAKDRVALYLPNCPEFVFWYLAIASLGAIVVPIHYSLTQSEIKILLFDCTASLLITNVEKRKQTIDEIPTLFIEEVQPAPIPTTFPSIQSEDELAILYTSGTTGLPKGAVLTHGNVHFVAKSIKDYCQTTPDDRLLLFVPLSHCFGQNLILNHALQSGASIVLTQSSDPKKLIKIIEEQEVTMIFGVPTMYRLFLQCAPEKECLKSVRYCHCGAAFLSSDLAYSWFDQFSLMIHQGYGLTESSPLACYNSSPKGNPTSVGPPIDKVKIKIVNDQEREVGPNELGEIVIQGPNVMKHYWNRPQETDLAIRNGWLYSGDIGYKDFFGNVSIVDRRKDLINVSGLKVYPAEVELILEEHPEVKEAAVIGIPDPILGERVRACIVLRNNRAISNSELIRFCKKKLAPFKIPEKFVCIDSLPRNSTGKLIRRILRKQLISHAKTNNLAEISN